MFNKKESKMVKDDELRNEPIDHYKNDGLSGHPVNKRTGPVEGGADNTRGKNKPSREGNSGGAKAGKDNPDD